MLPLDQQIQEDCLRIEVFWGLCSRKLFGQVFGQLSFLLRLLKIVVQDEQVPSQPVCGSAGETTGFRLIDVAKSGMEISGNEGRPSSMSTSVAANRVAQSLAVAIHGEIAQRFSVARTGAGAQLKCRVLEFGAWRIDASVASPPTPPLPAPRSFYRDPGCRV